MYRSAVASSVLKQRLSFSDDFNCCPPDIMFALLYLDVMCLKSVAESQNSSQELHDTNFLLLATKQYAEVN